MADIENDGFVTVHPPPAAGIAPIQTGRMCRVCRRLEVQPDGWCRKCGNKTGEDLVTEILREACNIIADEADAMKGGIEIIGTGEFSSDPRDAHVVDRVKELEDWIARAGVIVDQHREEIASWKMAADEAEREVKILRGRCNALTSAAAELVDRDCQYHGAEIRIPVASHGDAIRLVAQLRAAANLTRPSEARANE